MADACTPSNIPDGVDLVGYYVDGLCAAPPVKGKQHVGISSLATNAGTVGDCEPGNPPPRVWVGWVQLRRDAGVDPTIYCAHDSLSDFFAGYRQRDVRAAFQAAGVPEPHYWLILLGATAVPPGAVAVQYAQGLDGDRYDLSHVADFWPGVDTEDPMALDPNDPIVAEIRANAQQTRAEVTLGFQTNPDGSPWAGAPNYLSTRLDQLEAEIKTLSVPAGSGLSADQAQQLAGLAAAVERIEAALKGA